MFDQVNARLAFTAACMAVALGGCASSPPTLLIPNATQTEGATQVELLAISTRGRSDVEGEIYNGERSRDMSAHAINVSIPPNHVLGQVEWPADAIPDPETEFSVADLNPVAPEDVDDWFEAQESDGRVLFFVHGYNVKFADAVFRLAQLTNDASIEAAPVLFTWPSRGDLVGYYYDRESASYSRDPLELVLMEAARNDKVEEITILAHSMGSWIVMETLRQMSIRNGALPEKITDVILAAPDLDIDVFEQQFETLGDARPYFTFLVSSDDRALGISKMLAGGIQRVGAIDPSQEPYRSRIEATEGLTVVDLSNVEGEGTRHSKFAGSEVLMEIAEQGIQEEGAPSARRNSLGEHAGALIISLGQGVADLSN